MALRSILDLTVKSVTFPAPLKESAVEVVRDNILTVIEQIFEAGSSVVILDGEKGIGKTATLSQFARRHSSNTLSLFITPSNRFGYDRDYLRMDLCNQLSWILADRALAESEPTDEGLLRRSLFRLNQRTKLHAEVYYFVVDGLDDIPAEDTSSRRLILDLLPIGLNQCPLLISGNSNRLDPLLHPRACPQTCYMLEDGTPRTD